MTTQVVPISGRLQLALNVGDLDEAIAFYTKLFGTEPTKVRAGHAQSLRRRSCRCRKRSVLRVGL